MKAATAMREVARIAEMQDGLVTTSQAVRSGVPRLSLARLAESEDLERLTHGVYRVRGADEDEYTDLRAAWLAVDPGRTAAERAADLVHPIVVSHRSAAAVHGIGNLYADRHELTASVRKQSRRSDVVIHRADVPRSDITIARGMLVTTIERTLADLARTEPELGDVADALAGAHHRGTVDLERLAPMLDAAARRHGSRTGAELLERMLEMRGIDAVSRLLGLISVPGVREAAWRRLEELGINPAEEMEKEIAKQERNLRVALRVAASSTPWPTASDEVTRDE
jgi:predicted transcriptional regulator of viral defense system